MERLERKDLNEKEEKVFQAINRSKTITIKEIGEKCFANKPAAKRNSWARNSLRRLVDFQFIKKVDAGTYESKPETLWGKPIPGLEEKRKKARKLYAESKGKTKKTKKKKPAKAKKAKKPAKVKAASKKTPKAKAPKKEKPTKTKAPSKTPIKADKADKSEASVFVGQVYRANDPHDNGREVMVLDIVKEDDGVMVATCCSASTTSQGAREVHIQLKRFGDGTKKGYTLLGVEESKEAFLASKGIEAPKSKPKAPKKAKAEVQATSEPETEPEAPTAPVANGVPASDSAPPTLL